MFLVNGGWLSSKETPLMVTVRPADYEPFLQAGFTVFAIVTSSQPRYVVSDQMADVQRAARFIRHNAGRFGIDPQRLGVMGSSSGGQLTLSLATQRGPGPVDARDLVEREDSRVHAVACFFPPTDFLNYGAAEVDGLGAGPLAPLAPAFGAQGLPAAERRKLFCTALKMVSPRGLWTRLTSNRQGGVVRTSGRIHQCLLSIARNLPSHVLCRAG